jgi:hypothetical protein
LAATGTHLLDLVVRLVAENSNQLTSLYAVSKVLPISKHPRLSFYKHHFLAGVGSALLHIQLR